jgi:ATP-binding protein involved in chromosome partitioning
MTYVIISSTWTKDTIPSVISLLDSGGGLWDSAVKLSGLTDKSFPWERINQNAEATQGERTMVTVEAIEKELEKVVDPEIGLPITEMHLVDEISIQENGDIFIKYHLTAPFCPPIFAEDIGMNIRTLTSQLEGVKKVTVVLHGHALANEINQRVNPGYVAPQVQPAAHAQTKT